MGSDYPSIIIPTLGRAKQFASLVQNIYETTEKPFEIVVITEDSETIGLIRSELDALVELVVETGTPVQKWNVGAAWADNDWLVLVGDDCRFEPGWWGKVKATPNRGFVGLYEGVTWVNAVGHWAITRDCAQEVLGGVLALPAYKSGYFDQETCELMHQAGRYAVTKDIVLVHNHFSLGRSVFDETYRKGQTWQAEDKLVFETRKAAGYPIAWKPVF